MEWDGGLLLNFERWYEPLEKDELSLCFMLTGSDVLPLYFGSVVGGQAFEGHTCGDALFADGWFTTSTKCLFLEWWSWMGLGVCVVLRDGIAGGTRAAVGPRPPRQP